MKDLYFTNNITLNIYKTYKRSAELYQPSNAQWQ